MIIVTESAAAIKGFIAKTSLNDLAQAFVLRMALAFIMHRGRMSCSQAAGSIASETCHRGQITRFLARPRWQRDDFNAPLRAALLQMETGKGTFFSSSMPRSPAKADAKRKTPTARATASDAPRKDTATTRRKSIGSGATASRLGC